MRVGVQIGETIHDVTDEVGSVADWLRATVGRIEAAMEDLDGVAAAAAPRRASRFDQAPAPHRTGCRPSTTRMSGRPASPMNAAAPARQEEASDGGDVYARVYVATPPRALLQGQRRLGGRPA